MATESAVFTALPNGLHESGERWRVTIFVSPRLLTDGAGNLDLTGANFPAFADWPATIANTKFTILVDGVGSFDTEPDPDSPAPDSATWLALLRQDRGAGPQVQRHGRREVVVVPGRGRVAVRARAVRPSRRGLPGGLPTRHEWTAAGPRRRHRQPVVRRSPSLLPGARERVLDHAPPPRREEEDAPVALRRPHALPCRRAGKPRAGLGVRRGLPLPRPAGRARARARRTRRRPRPSRPRSTSTGSSRSAATTRSCCDRSVSRWTCS